MQDDDQNSSDENVIDMFGKGLPEEGEAIDTKGWIIVAAFSQLQGINENDMFKLVSYLGSKGVPATFNGSSGGLEGAGKTFMLSVPPEKKLEAEEFIKKFFSEISE